MLLLSCILHKPWIRLSFSGYKASDFHRSDCAPTLKFNAKFKVFCSKIYFPRFFRRLAGAWFQMKNALRWLSLNIPSVLSDPTCLDVYILDLCMCFGTEVSRYSDEIFCFVEEVHAWAEGPRGPLIQSAPLLVSRPRCDPHHFSLPAPHFPTNIITHSWWPQRPFWYDRRHLI